MKKIVKAVRPYKYKEGVNFKIPAYEAWVKTGGAVAKAHYPWRPLHRLFFNYDFPTLFHHKKESRLRFVQPVSLYFDAFPDYLFYEIIPVIWDCWPIYFEKTCKWLKKHRVKTAVFTSSQTAEGMRECFPEMNIITITEGIDIDVYSAGKQLKDRTIDLLEFGRRNDKVFKVALPGNLNHVHSKDGSRLFSTDEEFRAALADAKICVTFPRCDTQPEVAGDIETLTQRYWECMLSGTLMIGRAPRELIDLIGYNPVIESDGEDWHDVILKVLDSLGKYQELADRNRQVALQKGTWIERIEQFRTICK